MTVRWDDRQVRDIIRRAAARGVFRGGQLVRTHAVRSILGGAKSGRIYVRRGIAHQASAPGEPPASDTGRLANSIDVKLDAVRVVATVSASTRYAAFLEYGTQKMAPRPFMRPALAAQVDNIEAAIASELRKVLPR